MEEEDFGTIVSIPKVSEAKVGTITEFRLEELEAKVKKLEEFKEQQACEAPVESKPRTIRQHYKIIASSTGTNGLEGAVNEAIKEGWTCQGGLSESVRGGFEFFLQSMVKYVEE